MKTRSRTDFFVVHCSATPPDMDIGAHDIARWHIKDNGWRAIGYHYVIRRNGSIETGRREDKIGAHVRGFNDRSIGLCLVGGVDAQNRPRPENNFTPQQFDALERLLRELLEFYPQARVLGHRDFPNVRKACPSFDARAWAAGLGLPVAHRVTASTEDIELTAYQDLLRGAGHDPGPSDGWYGPRTETAIRQFQATHGLYPSGRLNPATKAALEQLEHERRTKVPAPSPTAFDALQDAAAASRGVTSAGYAVSGAVTAVGAFFDQVHPAFAAVLIIGVLIGWRMYRKSERAARGDYSPDLWDRTVTWADEAADRLDRWLDRTWTRLKGERKQRDFGIVQ